MNKVVVITGASSGMGEATAKLLGENGYNVVLGARREERLKEICDEINKLGKGKAVYSVTDVTKHDDVAKLVKKAIDEFGRIDVLFNDAGIMPNTPLIDNDYEMWSKAIDTNMKGTLYAIGEAMPHFKEQHSGQIINVSSVWGLITPATWSVYVGTKWAVRGMSDSIRKEVIPYNVRVNVLYPGAVDTEISTAIKDKKIKAEIDNGNAQMAISPNIIAQTIKQAIELPEEVTWNDIVIRPTVQEQ